MFVDQVLAVDRELEDWVRTRASALGSDDLTEDDLNVQLDRLYDDATPFGQDVEYEPDQDMVRIVKVGSFLRRMARDRVRHTFGGDEVLYRRALAAEPLRVENDLIEDPTAILLQSPYSWMKPKAAMTQDVDADVAAIRSPHVDAPPFVILHLPADLLAQSGVRVRPPGPLDAIPGRNWHWRRGDVPAEVIDRDIPRSACERAEYVDA